MFEKPLRVCYVSLVEFSSRCNGSPDPEWEMLEQPNGPVPRGGWCQNGNYCGYDVKVWECVFEKHYLYTFFTVKSLCTVAGKVYAHLLRCCGT
jgi:hypothetical protein